MTSTSIPAVLDWLYEQVAALDLPGVQVFDGQPDTDRIRNDFIVIGFSPEQAAVTLESAPAGLAHERFQEVYTIQNGVSSLRGATRLKPARDAAFMLLNQVVRVLAADPTCGGNVFRATLSVGTVEAGQTSEGAVCTIAFGVRAIGHTQVL